MGDISHVLYHWVSVLCESLSAIDTQKDSAIYFLYLQPRNWTPLGFVRAHQPNQIIIRFYESKNDTCFTARASD